MNAAEALENILKDGLSYSKAFSLALAIEHSIENPYKHAIQWATRISYIGEWPFSEEDRYVHSGPQYNFHGLSLAEKYTLLRTIKWYTRAFHPENPNSDHSERYISRLLSRYCPANQE